MFIDRFSCSIDSRCIVCLQTSEWTVAIFLSFSRAAYIQYLYEITNPFIWKCIFKAWGVGLYNLQLFKALVLVMNYFVISTVMRFIFNNCNNYFIKKRSHALWLSRQGLKLEGILIKSIILPRCAFSWMSR